MRNRLSIFLITVATLLLIACMVFTTVALTLRDAGYIETLYDANDVDVSEGISLPELSKATETLFDYMRGERDDIVVSVTVNGTVVSDLFSHEKEIVHMAEVRTLWRNLTVFTFVGGAASLLLFFVGGAIGVAGKRLRAFAHGLLIGGCIFGVLVLVIAFWALLDFDSFWTIFHFILFPRSLFQYVAAGASPEAYNALNWVLSSDCVLVTMLTPLFAPLVTRIALFAAGELAAVLALALILRAVTKPKVAPVPTIAAVAPDPDEPKPVMNAPNLVLAHRLRNASVSKRKELRNADKPAPKPPVQDTPKTDEES